jgi:hypothetical protein
VDGEKMEEERSEGKKEDEKVQKHRNMMKWGGQAAEVRKEQGVEETD